MVAGRRLKSRGPLASRSHDLAGVTNCRQQHLNISNQRAIEEAGEVPNAPHNRRQMCRGTGHLNLTRVKQEFLWPQVTSRIVGALRTFAKHSIDEINSAITTLQRLGRKRTAYLESRPDQPSRARDLRAWATNIVPRLPLSAVRARYHRASPLPFSKQQKAPDELDHAPPDSGVACFGEPCSRQRQLRGCGRKGTVIVIDWRLRRGAGPS